MSKQHRENKKNRKAAFKSGMFMEVIRTDPKKETLILSMPEEMAFKSSVEGIPMDAVINGLPSKVMFFEHYVVYENSNGIITKNNVSYSLHEIDGVKAITVVAQ
jgi:hypothetical protein